MQLLISPKQTKLYYYKHNNNIQCSHQSRSSRNSRDNGGENDIPITNQPTTNPTPFTFYWEQDIIPTQSPQSPPKSATQSPTPFMNDDVPTQSPIQPTESPTSQSPTPNDNDIPEDGDDEEGDGGEEDDDEEDDDGNMTFSVSHILFYEKRGSVYHMCVYYVYLFHPSIDPHTSPPCCSYHIRHNNPKLQ